MPKSKFDELEKRFDMKLERLSDEMADHLEKTAERIINEFSNKIDPVLKQYAKTEESNEILTHKVYQDHEPRITTLEVRDKKKN